MSTTPLSIEDIHSIVNTAWSQFTDATEDTPSDVSAIDFTKFSDTGSTEDILKLREKFTKALIVQIAKTYYKDRLEGVDLDDPYYEDADSFGAIVQVISAKMPTAISNEAMQDFVSGTTKTGQYTVYTPIVDNQLFIKQTSWELPVTISGQQWDAAFKDQASLDRFVLFIMNLFYRNTDLHSQLLSQVNRNGFMAHKINENNGVINLIKAYYEDGRYNIDNLAVGDHTLTWDEMKNNADFLKWSEMYIEKVRTRMRELNNLYSTDTEPQSVPEEQIVCEFLDEYTQRLKLADSYIYHNDLLKLPNCRIQSHWQTGGTEAVEQTITAKLGVDVSDNDIIVSQQKIIGLMVDRRAIMHTRIKQRMASQYHDIEYVTHYRAQYVDSFINNLAQKGVVFTVADYTFTKPSGESSEAEPIGD